MTVYIKVFYDWIEQTQALSDAERGRLFVAMLEYARSGALPEMEGNERILFPVFKAQIDRDLEVYAEKVAGGKKGGRPKKDKPEETSPNQKKPAETKNKNKDKDKEKEEENKEDKKEKGASAPEEGANAPKGDASVPDTPTLLSLVCECSFSDTLREHVQDWVQYKSERKEGYKAQGLKALLRQIEVNTARYGEDAVCEVIEQSMAAGWKGIVFDRLKAPAAPSAHSSRETAASSSFSRSRRELDIRPEDYDNGPQYPWEV